MMNSLGPANAVILQSPRMMTALTLDRIILMQAATKGQRKAQRREFPIPSSKDKIATPTLET